MKFTQKWGGVLNIFSEGCGHPILGLRKVRKFGEEGGGGRAICERFANLGGGGGFPPGFSAASPEPFGAHIFHDMPCHVSHLVSVCYTGGNVQVSQ